MNVTILITCAGSGLYFQEALLSVLAQSHAEFKVYVIDNASPSNVYKDVVASLSDDRVIYRRENVRLPMTLNWQRCFKYLSGGVFCFLHDDDVWPPDYLNEVVAIFESQLDCGCVVSQQLNFTTDSVGEIQNLEFKFLEVVSIKQIKAAFILNDLAHMSACVFREFEYSFESTSEWNPDQRYVQNYSNYGRLIVNLGSIVSIRQHPAQVTHSTGKRQERVQEREEVIRKNLFHFRNDEAFRESTLAVARKCPESAFRLFRGVCSWPINKSTLEAYKIALGDRQVVESLSRRFPLSKFFNVFGIVGLCVLSLTIDIGYLVRR